MLTELQMNGDDTRYFEVIPHTLEAIDDLLFALHSKTKGNIAIAVELSKGPIVYALQKQSFVTVFPVYGLTSSQYRRALFPSGAKDDPMDAELALDMMLKYPDKAKPLKPISDECRTLALLVEHRRSLVDDKRRNTNRLINVLKQYYPQPLEWFSHRDSELLCDFLLRRPNLGALKRARIITIENFFKIFGNTTNRLPFCIKPYLMQTYLILYQALGHA